MAIGYIIWNSLSGADRDDGDVKALSVCADHERKLIDIRDIKDYKTFLCGLERDDYIIIAGGDGTLNRFVNDTDGISFDNKIFYYPRGTGNDFACELGYKKGCEPFDITEYLRDLPTVEVKGETYRFLNGVGYGIDGYCCEVGDELKKIPGKKVNYTAIAIKGLLFRYKPTAATVTVDGVSRRYKKVWIAPTMNGKYYGGGMMPTPDQDRTDKEGKLSVMVFHGSGKMRTLTVFPSIFKGEHVKHTKMVEVLKGKEIIVEFDSPRSLQIDGETIISVTSYKAKAALRSKKEEKILI